jgi:hypothetical protein
MWEVYSIDAVQPAVVGVDVGLTSGGLDSQTFTHSDMSLAGSSTLSKDIGKIVVHWRFTTSRFDGKTWKGEAQRDHVLAGKV